MMLNRLIEGGKGEGEEEGEEKKREGDRNKLACSFCLSAELPELCAEVRVCPDPNPFTAKPTKLPHLQPPPLLYSRAQPNRAGPG